MDTIFFSNFFSFLFTFIKCKLIITNIFLLPFLLHSLPHSLTHSLTHPPTHSLTVLLNPNRVESYIDSLDWIKDKKATINSINRKDSKSFQYAKKVALNYEEVRKHAETISIKPFMKQYKRERIYFHQKKMIRKAFVKKCKNYS